MHIDLAGPLAFRATQEERVSMLKLALQCKGVHIPTMHPHEDGPQSISSEGSNAQQVEHDDGAPNAQGQQLEPQAETQTEVNTAEGIFL